MSAIVSSENVTICVVRHISWLKLIKANQYFSDEWQVFTLVLFTFNGALDTHFTGANAMIKLPRGKNQTERYHG